MADRLRTLARGLGQVLITLGVVLLLFSVYELKITNLYTDRVQRELGAELQREWATRPIGPVVPAGPVVPVGSAVPAIRPVAVRLGEGFAVLRIPRLGRDYAKVVVEGVGVPDLKRGPGHYPGTALPGQVGNVVLSGHRTTYGAPFNRLGELRPGDAVVLETATSWFTYRMVARQIVAPTDVQVLLPVPGRPGVPPTQRLLTLTTCHPEYSAKQRMIVTARLEAALPKAAGAPPALAQTLASS